MSMQLDPGNLPAAARDYVANTEGGLSFREIAARNGCHASTVMRRVRLVETRRDDPLVDMALERAARLAAVGPACAGATPLDQFDAEAAPGGQTSPGREEERILRRLNEPGASLALASGMENAVVMRETDGAEPMRTAVVGRAVAEAMALNGWIRGGSVGRIQRYRITAPGRGALRRAEAAAADEGGVRAGDRGESFGQDRGRYVSSESPLMSLARRKDKTGKPYLTHDLVRVGETLREDFELAQMGPRLGQNWDRFLAGPVDGENSGDFRGHGPEAARARVENALADLGPGLGDVALRACCFLEGMEAIEHRMGWAARSGKIVLRIALQRLLRHYDERHGGVSPLIG